MKNIGDKAPEVLGINEKGEEIRLSAYKGKKIVLYFYPKDSTSGCTAQACNLRDNYSELRKAGYEVIGVSVDSEKSHQKFIDKNNLPFEMPDLQQFFHGLRFHLQTWPAALLSLLAAEDRSQSIL